MEKRKNVWEKYYEELNKIQNKDFITCKKINNCTGNYHIFYLLFENKDNLFNLKKYLTTNNIMTTTHYIPLHQSEYYLKSNNPQTLLNAERFGNTLLRLPIFYSITDDDVQFIITKIINYYSNL